MKFYLLFLNFYSILVVRMVKWRYVLCTKSFIMVREFLLAAFQPFGFCLYICVSW